MKKKIVLIFLVTTLIMVNAYCLDFNIRPRGYVLIPQGADQTDTYELGGGGELLLDIDIATIFPNPIGLGYTVGVEGGYGFAPLKSGNENLSLLSGGFGLSLYYFPFSRLLMRLDGAFGMYQGSLVENTSSWYYRYGGELGFRFTPNFTLSGNAGYKYYNNPFGGESYPASSGKPTSPNALFEGVYVGLTGQITVEVKGAGSARSGVNVTVDQADPIYPVFLNLYQTYEAANLILRNNESAEIRNVRVSFRAAGYTASEFPCATLSRISKGRREEIPLLADFSTAIYNFTESGRIVGEVVIRYTILGAQKEVVRSAIVQVHNRNIFPQGDNTGLASFVNPASHEVQEYAKAVAGVARGARRQGVNVNLQNGIWLFEGIRASGIGVNRTAPAQNDEEDSHLVEVQYPAQTLAFRSGTPRDIGLLYAASLEAIGIPAALVPIENDFIVAINLEAAQSSQAALFRTQNKVLIINDQIYLPVLMSRLNDGFAVAWQQAANRLNAMFAANQAADLVILQDAWLSYPSAPFPPMGARITPPDMNAVARYADAAITSYVNNDQRR